MFKPLVKRIKLHSRLGDYVYDDDIFDQIKITDGDGIAHNGSYNKEEDIKWLTAWRDKELNILSKQAAFSPTLLANIAELKDRPISIMYLGAAVVVTGIGNIGPIMLSLNENEMKNYALAKTASRSIFASVTTTDTQSSEDRNNKISLPKSFCRIL